MRSFTCSGQYGHWSCMWIAPKFGENPPNCWCVLVLAAAGLQRQSRGFLTGWETPFRWLSLARSLPSPLSLRAHSTRGVASCQALFRGIPLEDICVAAGCSSPHTFVRFYNLDIDTAPGSQVLSVWTSRMLLVRYWTRWGSVFSLACLVYRSQSVKAHAALSEPMIENVSGYSRNPCSLNRETLHLLPSSSRCRQGSFQQRNLRSRWRVRQYKLTTCVCQRRRRAISQWIGVIL